MCVEELGALFLVWLVSVSSGCEGPMEHEAAESAPVSRPDDGASGSLDAPRLDAAVLLDASEGDAASGGPDVARRDAETLADAAPRLSALVETFFGPTCVLGRCHTTLAPAGDLSLTGRRISAYEALVNAPSSQVSERLRVVPYDPTASYLMEKLERDMPAAGTRMPPSSSAVSQAQIDSIRAWILAGALDN